MATPRVRLHQGAASTPVKVGIRDTHVQFVTRSATTSAVPGTSRQEATMKTSRHLLILSGLVIGAGFSGSTDARQFAAADEPVRVTLSAADVRASNEEARSAYGALVSMWSNEFRAVGEQFVAPRLARYSGNIRTPCGIVPASNAAYCGANNTIYY